MDPGKLAEMLADVQEKKLGLQSLLVIRGGYLVSETYFGADKDTRHELYSCTKSFSSTLIGIALDRGKIDRLDQPVLDFFPEDTFENIDARKQAMTLEDVLTMRAGLRWTEGDSAYGALYRAPDWVQFMLDKPMAVTPGSLFNYCSGCSHLLTAIIQQAAGMDTLEFADQNLFQPLGISGVQWDTDSAGIPIGGWGLKLTPREMAKLGYLFLHEGRWDGQQIVSAEWVRAATQEHTRTGDSRGYGYQWWTFASLEGYAALGRYGQVILVIPKRDLVVVATAQMNDSDEVIRLVEQYVVPSIQE
jgi:CubicO group peptidase (beta-lactamase class C family)